MTDVLETLGEFRDDLGVENTDGVRRVVVAVDSG
jgi:hypothetical protein